MKLFLAFLFSVISFSVLANNTCTIGPGHQSCNMKFFKIIPTSGYVAIKTSVDDYPVQSLLKDKPIETLIRDRFSFNDIYVQDGSKPGELISITKIRKNEWVSYEPLTFEISIDHFGKNILKRDCSTNELKSLEATDARKGRKVIWGGAVDPGERLIESRIRLNCINIEPSLGASEAFPFGFYEINIKSNKFIKKNINFYIR